MKRNSLIGLFILVVFAFLLSSCGGGGSGSPGSSGAGDTGCMPIVESVAPSNTFLSAGNLTESESVNVTIGVYDLPNQTGTCSGVTFTQYKVQYIPIPLHSAGPRLNDRVYTGTWYVDANKNATFTLTFWDYFTKYEYRYPNDPKIYTYDVKFTMTGYNVFGKKITLTFDFQVNTKL